MQPLACQGTQGAWHTNNTANIDTPGLSLTGLSARARGRQHDVFNAYGQTQGRVGKVNIGNGEIVVRGVIASARVTKTRGKLSRTAKDTTVTSLSVRGHKRRIPARGTTITIPGIAKVTGETIHKLRYGLDVTAVKVVLLNKPNSTLIIGHAVTHLRPL